MKRFLTTIIAVALSLCLLLFVVNIAVDSANLLRSDRITSDIFEINSAGKNAIVPNNYNDRDLAYNNIKMLEQPVDTAVLGSSRGIQISSQMLGLSDSELQNSCVTGAVLEDVVSLWQAYLDTGNIPNNVILVTDIWFFDQRKIDERFLLTYENEYKTFIEQNVETEISLSQPNYLANLQPLLTIPYFQENMKTVFDGSFLTNKVYQTENYSEPDNSVIHPDGSYSYPLNYVNASKSEIDERIRIGLPTISSEVGGYEKLDEQKVLIFEQLIKSMTQNGVQVVLYLSPYHPSLVEEFNSNTLTYQMFFKTEEYLKELEQEGVSVVGSFDNKNVGLFEQDFLDPLHITEQATAEMVEGIG